MNEDVPADTEAFLVIHDDGTIGPEVPTCGGDDVGEQQNAFYCPSDNTVIASLDLLLDDSVRLVTLIDICYEMHRRVIVSAAAYPDELYRDGPAQSAFRRVASRLAEMQTWGEAPIAAKVEAVEQR